MRMTTILFTAAMLGTFAGVANANLLQNGSFEKAGNEPETARHWKVNDPAESGDAWGSAIRVDWRAKDGAHIGAIRGKWAGAGEYGGFWQEARIEPGKTYRASAWCWADNSWGAGVQELKIEFWGEDRTEKLGERSVSLSDVREDWTLKEVTLDAPANAVWGRVVINVSEVGDNGALQVDQVALDPVSYY
jgi:hypothetical protein